MKRPVFFLKRSDRLIARLRHLVYALRFAQQIDGVVILAWAPLPKYFQQFDTENYEVDRIFDVREHYAQGGHERLVFFHSVIPFPKSILSLQGSEFEHCRPDKFSRRELLARPEPVFYSGAYVNFQFEDEQKSTVEMGQEVQAIFEAIPRNEVIVRVVEAAKDKLGGERYVALHVRRGDVGEMIKRDLPRLAMGQLEAAQLRLTISHYLSRTAPYSFYYPAVERAIAEGSRILFTSDSPETLTHFAEKYGPTNFVDVNRFVRARYPIQKAFMDFLMLADAKRIVSTGSTYAAFAATLGGSELINVARGGPIETLEQFLISEYAPELSSNRRVREILQKEIETLCNSKGLRFTRAEGDQYRSVVG